jgi:hypothetical protein
MRGDRPQDAMAMVAIAFGLAALAAARHAGDWLDALGRQPHCLLAAVTGPGVLLLGLVLVAALVAAVVWRRRLCRDLLADRVELQLVPSPEFDPSIEAVERLASQLGRTRRRGRGRLERPAAAVRFAIDSDGSGRLAYASALRPTPRRRCTPRWASTPTSTSANPRPNPTTPGPQSRAVS